MRETLPKQLHFRDYSECARYQTNNLIKRHLRSARNIDETIELKTSVNVKDTHEKIKLKRSLRMLKILTKQPN